MKKQTTSPGHHGTDPNPARDTARRPMPRGYGAMRDIPLNIDPRINLTQPIYEQVLALQKLDEAAES